MPILTTGGVVRLLRQEGIPRVNHESIIYAVRRGYVTEPQRSTTGHFLFSDDNVAEIRKYLLTPRRPGNKKRTEAAAATS